MKLAHKFKSYGKWTEEPRSIHALLSLEMRKLGLLPSLHYCIITIYFKNIPLPTDLVSSGSVLAYHLPVYT